MPNQKYRIQNKTTLRALESLARFSERSFFQPLHGWAQRFHQSVSQPILRWNLKRSFMEIEDFYFRHSVTQAREFNLLLSDLDGTIVIKDDTSKPRIELILEKITQLRGLMLNLGEIEIYTTTEHRKKAAIESQHAAVIEAIRTIRKFDWMAPPQDLAQRLPYHTYKTDRSQKKVLLKMNRMNLEGFKDINIEGLERDQEFETSLIQHFGSGRSFLERSDWLKLGLVAAIPLTPTSRALLLEQPALAAVKRDLAIHEALICRGRARSFPDEQDDLIRYALLLEKEARSLDQSS